MNSSYMLMATFGVGTASSQECTGQNLSHAIQYDSVWGKRALRLWDDCGFLLSLCWVLFWGGKEEWEAGWSSFLRINETTGKSRAMLPWVLQPTQIYIEQNTLQNIMLHEKPLNVVQPGGARCKEKSACSKNRLFAAYTVQTTMFWCTVEKVVKVAILACGGWNFFHKQQTGLHLQLVYEIKGWDTPQLSSGRPLYKILKNMVLISASKYFSGYL